jgi:hypothetical protein
MDTSDSSATTKSTLIRVLDELSLDCLSEVLDFALFVKARQMRQSRSLESQYPLHGTVVHYDDPFTPVAQLDWEASE